MRNIFSVNWVLVVILVILKYEFSEIFGVFSISLSAASSCSLLKVDSSKR